MIQAIPKNIGKYTILGELGRGTTSVVYRGQDPFADREVAIKVFNPSGFSDDDERKRFSKLFLAESSIAGKLNHPHVVNIYDAVINSDEAYIVMEIVTGTALDEYAVADKLLPIETVTQIMFKCCAALDYAARNGIIHRDIKPANIMYTKDGEVKITDFGAALILNTDRTQTVGVGSPAYMSPEQIEERTLTHQTDIYSLGVVMFKLLTGRLPFEADTTFALMHKIVKEPALNVLDLRPKIPHKLAAIVHKAIDKNTHNRYARWSDLSSDLASCVMPTTQLSKTITDSEKFNLLKPLDFFLDFTEVELWELLRISQWARFPAGKVLMKEGDTGSSFYMLSDGSVMVSKMGKMLTTLNKGDCFGEMAYIDKENSTRSANVTSLTPVTLIKIKSTSLEAATDTLQLKFNRIFLKTLVRRLARNNTELAILGA